MFGVVEAFNVHTERLMLGATTALFFVGYGAGLVGCAWAMTRLQPWSRSPVLLAQLIWLGLAWNLRSGATLPVAVALAISAAVVLAGVLHPGSIEALNREEHRHH